MKEFRFVGSHAEELEGGRPLNPGDYTGPINERGSKTAQLVRDGYLIEVPDGTADEVRKINDASVKQQVQDGGDDVVPVAPYGVPPEPEKPAAVTTARSGGGTSDAGKDS